MEKLNFHIITPYYGPDHLLEECIHSVRMQTLSATHHIIIDNNRKGGCRNHFETLQLIPPNKNNIIIHLDGDDKLINYKTLEILSKIYEDPNIWVTYGNYVSRLGSVCLQDDHLPFRESFGRNGWRWSHLRTFRAHLIPHLKESDMKDSLGNWFSAAPDVAIFLPILEMSGKNRVKFIDEDLVYYRIHSGNEHASPQKLNDQIRCSRELMSKKPYNKLP